MFEKIMEEVKSILNTYTLTQNQYQIIESEVSAKLKSYDSLEGVNPQLVVEAVFREKGYVPNKRNYTPQSNQSRKETSTARIIFGSIFVLIGLNMLFPMVEFVTVAVIVVLFILAINSFKNKSPIIGLLLVFLGLLIADVKLFYYDLGIFYNLDKVLPVTFIIAGLSILFNKKS